MAHLNTKPYVVFCGLLFATVALYFIPSLSSSRVDIFSSLRNHSPKNRFQGLNAAHYPEIKTLRAKLAVLKRKLLLAEDKIQKLTKFREKFSQEKYPLIIPAIIIAKRDSSSLRHSFVVDRGLKDGVIAGDIVVSGISLVGRIWHVSTHSSRALCIYDPQMRVPIMLVSTIEGEKAGNEGVCVGMGHFCQLQLVEKNYQQWTRAQVLTSGFRGEYPPGLSIGSVKRPKTPKAGLFWDLPVANIVELNKIHSVLIVKQQVQ